MLDDPFRVTLPAADLPELGFRRPGVSAMVRAGEWRRLRYADYQVGSPLPRPEDQHDLLVRATVEHCRVASSAVVSHVSAAVLWGLPTWGIDLERVHLTRPGRAGCSTSVPVIPHRGRLTDAEITEVDGIPVTSLARTVLDVARYHGFERGVVVADAALRTGLAREALAEVLAIANDRGSAGCAGRVIDFADARAESAGESRSRVALAVLGLPTPELQRRFYDDYGRFIGRSDFWLPEFGTVGEFDGMGKYGLTDSSPADAVANEKVREDGLRDLGLQVVRWITRDLRTPLVILGRFERAFVRAGHPGWSPRPRPNLLAPGSERRSRRRGTGRRVAMP